MKNNNALKVRLLVVRDRERDYTTATTATATGVLLMTLALLEET
jgi:hypothetical protein